MTFIGRGGVRGFSGKGDVSWTDLVIASPGLEGNFHKYALGAASYLGAPYDYGSVLHYSRQAFSKNNKDTISPLDPTAEIGQRRGLSTIDTWQLMKLYNCPVKPLPSTSPEFKKYILPTF